MLKLFSLLFIVATTVAVDSENIRRARSPGGGGWQGSSSFAPQSGGLTRSPGNWNSASGFGRSIGGWGNSERHGTRSSSYKSNGFNSNDVSGRSGFDSESVRISNTWDDSGIDHHSTW